MVNTRRLFLMQIKLRNFISLSLVICFEGDFKVVRHKSLFWSGGPHARELKFGKKNTNCFEKERNCVHPLIGSGEPSARAYQQPICYHKYYLTQNLRCKYGHNFVNNDILTYAARKFFKNEEKKIGLIFCFGFVRSQ